MIGRPGLWPFHIIRILREIAQQDNKKAWHYAPSEVQVLVLVALLDFWEALQAVLVAC